VLIGVSQMLADLPELVELDINPLLADDEGVLALDARIRLDRSGAGGSRAFRDRTLPRRAGAISSSGKASRSSCDRSVRKTRRSTARSSSALAVDLRLRFFSFRRELPRSEIARLTQIDYSREMAFIAARARADGGEETLGVVRAVCDPDNVEAEFAIVVRSDLTTAGRASALSPDARLPRRARNPARRRLRAARERRNAYARAGRGFVIDARNSDPDTVTLVKTLRPRSAPAKEDADPSR
jgi:acetyltransferase